MNDGKARTWKESLRVPGCW